MGPSKLEAMVSPISKTVTRRVVAVIALVWLVEIVLLWAFRTRNPFLLGLVRRFNRSLLNPVVARFAGRRGFYAATIHHVGRRSGIPYATPVLAQPVADGLLIPLPYGIEVDWLRNVLAAGRAIVDADGRTVVTEHPAVLPFEEVAERLSERMARSLRLVGTRDVLHLTTTGLATPATA